MTIGCPQHLNHLWCIFYHLARFLNEDQCKICRGIVLEIQGLRKCAFCGTCIGEGGVKCKMGRFLCDSCILDFENTEFCKDCSVCKVKKSLKQEELKLEDLQQESKFDEMKKRENTFNTGQNAKHSALSKTMTARNMDLLDFGIQSIDDVLPSEDRSTDVSIHGTMRDEDCYKEDQFLVSERKESFNFDESHTIPKCSRCYRPAPIANSCNHNYCEDCLRDLIEKSLKNFQMLFQAQEFDKIPNKFLMKCINQGCSKVFKLPSIYMKQLIPHMKELSLFSIYFEGGKTLFSVCHVCREVSGKCGKVKFGCKCE
jgi:hypothetical protein